MRHAEELYQQVGSSSCCCCATALWHCASLFQVPFRSPASALSMAACADAACLVPDARLADAAPALHYFGVLAHALQGFLSYPRTETDQFDQNYDLRVSKGSKDKACQSCEEGAGLISCRRRPGRVQPHCGVLAAEVAGYTFIEHQAWPLHCTTVLQGMIEAQAGGGAPWSAYAQRLLAPESQLFRWPRPGGHDDKVRWRVGGLHVRCSAVATTIVVGTAQIRNQTSGFAPNL